MHTPTSQLGFLKAMVLYQQDEESRRLLSRISQVESQERRSRRWLSRIILGLGALAALVAVATQGWEWVLIQSQNFLAQAILWASGIAIFSLTVVLGSWLWHRSALRHLARETQRYLAGCLAWRPEPKPKARGRCRASRAGVGPVPIPCASHRRLDGAAAAPRRGHDAPPDARSR